MIGSVILFLMVIIPSICISQLINKEVEYVILGNTALLILNVFLSGVFLNTLIYGLYINYIYFISCIACLIYLMIKNKITLQTLNSKGLMFLLFITALFLCMYRNAVCVEPDEFSHWALVVKQMTIFDDFGTNPSSITVFKSYPPGISIFQYIAARTNMLLGYKYSETPLFYPYQLLLFISFLPVLKLIENKDKFLSILLYITVIFIVPTFYIDVYKSIYIDPILSVFSGTATAFMILSEKRDVYYHLNVFSYLFILTLIKDSGLMLAIFAGIIYLINNNNTKKFLHSLSLLFAVILLSKGLWNLEIANVNKSFSNRIDFKELINVLFGTSQGYRLAVIDNFVNRFFKPDFSFSMFRLNFLVHISLLLIVLAVVLIKNKKTRNLIVILTEVVVYIFGLLVLYLFKFSEYEAVILASYDRYMATIVTSLYITTIIVVTHFVSLKHTKNTILTILIACVAYPLPVNPFYVFQKEDTNYLNRKYHNLYNNVAYLDENVENDKKIFVLAEASQGFEGLYYRYQLPDLVLDCYSIYQEKLYSNDFYTLVLDENKFIDLLSTYDYLFVHNYETSYIKDDLSLVKVYPSIFRSEVKQGVLYDIKIENNILKLKEIN